jgi:excisionase family DNA binding protein
MEDLVKIEDIAKLLNIKVATVATYVHNKKIPFLKINGCLRFDMEQINEWLKSKAVVVVCSTATCPHRGDKS